MIFVNQHKKTTVSWLPCVESSCVHFLLMTSATGRKFPVELKSIRERMEQHCLCFNHLISSHSNLVSISQENFHGNTYLSGRTQAHIHVHTHTENLILAVCKFCIKVHCKDYVLYKSLKIIVKSIKDQHL